jgi:hypothetical protein
MHTQATVVELFDMLKNAVFWDVTQCGSCKNRRLGRTYSLYLQDQKKKRTGNNVAVGSNSESCEELITTRNEAIEWDVPHDRRERKLLVTVFLSCSSVKEETQWQVVASQRTLPKVTYVGGYHNGMEQCGGAWGER